MRFYRHESPNPARVAKRRGRDLVTSEGKTHEKQYHVHFLARYDNIGLNTNIL